VLVSRHLNVVYSAALRQLNGDHARAADIAQIVFTALARKAPKLIGHPTLVGWLHKATQLAAREELRHTAQRLCKTQILAKMESEPQSTTEVLPRLDAWLAELRAADRQLLLLRFFEGYSYPRLASLIGVREDAVRMRVERALQRLRERARKSGIASTAEAIAALLVEQGAVAAPESLAQNVQTSSLATVRTEGSAGNAVRIGHNIGAVLVATSLVILAAGTGLAWQHFRTRNGIASVGGSESPADPLQSQRALPPNSRQSRMQAWSSDEVAPRVHVDLRDLPPDVPTSDAQPHALAVNGEPYAAEIAVTMNWRNPLGLSSDQKEIVQAAYQSMRREETSIERGLAQARSPAPNRVDLTIQPFAGETLLEKFAASLDHWLGPGMGSRFFDAYRMEILRDGQGFGEFLQEITLVRTAPDLVEIQKTFQFNPSLVLTDGSIKISIDTPFKVSSTSRLPVDKLGPWAFLSEFVPPQ
jgi:RNA polymerase sigma factor (sigma-70 family)